MRSGSIDEKFSFFRRSIQMTIADALHAIDRATGSTMERRILSGVLDRLGADGVVSFLNEDTPDMLGRHIYYHVRWLEERAVDEAREKSRTNSDRTTAGE